MKYVLIIFSMMMYPVPSIAQNSYASSIQQHLNNYYEKFIHFFDFLNSNEPANRCALQYGHAEMQGKRPAMEDAWNAQCDNQWCTYGLYDGHGGSAVSRHVASVLNKTILQKIKTSTPEQALLKSYIEVDNNLPKNIHHQGTTALTALINKDMIIIANTGDSRAVLCSNATAIALTSDQKADRPDEIQRIEKAGGKIINRDIPRVQGILAISRAIGDHMLAPYVISHPEITMYQRTNHDQFLILACDGVWDVINNEEAVNIIMHTLNNNGTIHHAADALTHAAYNRGSSDNISALVINLKK